MDLLGIILDLVMILSYPRPAAGGTLFVVVVAMMERMQTVLKDCFHRRSMLIAI
jgi:hypothetical protein